MEYFSEQDKEFIRFNLTTKVDNLLLQNHKNQPENIKSLAAQIKSRQKIKEKLPTWYKNFNLVMPKSISVEQSSSEITAKFKSNIAKGGTLVDLTGGMGIDFWAMSQQFEKAIYIEQITELKEVAEFNTNQLGIKNAVFHAENAMNFIENYTEKIDWVFVDPARRDKFGGKVFSLADCEPNLLEIKELLLLKAENILIKCAPMLDIDMAIKQLANVANIYIITVENEVKELLFHLRKSSSQPIISKVIHLKKDICEEFSFKMVDEKKLEFEIGPPQKYLFEPHSGIMKAGAFKTISETFNCKKLHQNTHLYTSDSLTGNFPGRSFEIVDIFKPDKSVIKMKIPSQKANLTIRNFPGNVVDLRKKLNLKDGGDVYLFACTNNLNEKIILQTIKIN